MRVPNYLEEGPGAPQEFVSVRLDSVDHSGVLTTVTVLTPSEKAVPREVWCFGKAAWKELRKSFAETNWDEVLAGRVEDAAQYFTELLLCTARFFVPRRTLEEKKRSHA